MATSLTTALPREPHPVFPQRNSDALFNHPRNSLTRPGVSLTRASGRAVNGRNKPHRPFPTHRKPAFCAERVRMVSRLSVRCPPSRHDSRVRSNPVPPPTTVRQRDSTGTLILRGPPQPGIWCTAPPRRIADCLGDSSPDTVLLARDWEGRACGNWLLLLLPGLAQHQSSDP